SKAERNEQKLQPAIGSDRGHRLLHDFELAGIDGDVIEKNGGDYDPDDFEKPERCAVEEAAGGKLIGHLKNDDCHQNCGNGSSNRAQMGTNLESCEQAEENDEGEGGNER